MVDRLKRLTEKFEKVEIDKNAQEFSIILEGSIKQKIDNLTKYLNNFKIYIIFMGTTSSGKSTFINALLGQQLLPSSYQICTSQVVYIGHQNKNDDGNLNININEQFASLEDASKQLTKMQEEKQMGRVNIKTHSYFHSTLNKDLQERVYFIDTYNQQNIIRPGINLSQCQLENYVKHFADINEFIELDEYSVRINVWMTNYTTLESDKELQSEIMSMLQNKDEQNQMQKQFLENKEVEIKIAQSQENNQVQQSIPFYFIVNKFDESSIPFYYIINKFDVRNESEDFSEETQDLFNSDQVFKISAFQVLGYNIMNYGTQDAKDKFICKFYEDQKFTLGFVNQEKAQLHCNKKIKENNQLIKNQEDFLKFTQQITNYIQTVTDKTFDGNLNDLSQLITLFELGEDLAKAKQQLTKLQLENIAKFIKAFPQDKQNYEKELEIELIDAFFKQIDDLVSQAQSKIRKYDPEPVIRETCKITIDKIDNINKKFLFRTLTFKKQLLNQLRSVLKQDIDNDQEKYASIIIQKCETIFKQFMEDNIFQYKMQFVAKQATELYSKMGIIVSRSFYEKAYSAAANNTFLIGTGLSLGLSIIGFPTQPRFLLGSVAFTACVNYSYQQKSTKLHIDIPILTKNLKEWQLSLEQQVKDLFENYIKIYGNTLEGIKILMERILN